MAQDIGDCFEWAPVSQQSCGKCVAEQVQAPPTSSSSEAGAREAPRTLAISLFSGANGSKGAQWRKRMVRCSSKR
jgi:hypothetical protein